MIIFALYIWLSPKKTYVFAQIDFVQIPCPLRQAQTNDEPYPSLSYSYHLEIAMQFSLLDSLSNLSLSYKGRAKGHRKIISSFTESEITLVEFRKCCALSQRVETSVDQLRVLNLHLSLSTELTNHLKPRRWFLEVWVLYQPHSPFVPLPKTHSWISPSSMRKTVTKKKGCYFIQKIWFPSKLQQWDLWIILSQCYAVC